MKTLFATLLSLLTPLTVFAVDTSVTYNSGLLVMLFIGFCAFLVIVQLIPAVLMLIGMAKSVKSERKILN